ncbi:MAG TPA: MSHA biogenesis protein MshI [Burkholderiales bacterium]
MSQQINLFSEVLLKKRKVRYSAVTILQALGLIVVGAVLIYGYLVYQTGVLAAQAAEAEKKLASERENLAKLISEYAPQQKSVQLETEIKKAEAQLKARQEMVDKLKQGGPIGSTEGFSEYMRAFARQSVNGLWLTGFNIAGAGNEMAIIGRAVRPELVPVYVQRLSREPVMKGRQFAFLKISLPQQTTSVAKPAGNLRYLDFSLQSSAEQGKRE